ncbi:gamma-glutamylcyclotransferase family protein [Arenibacter sp. GZD96]|uniref:gamma-glutamylcyclotransferase family protein n=1 Tax=Aurantibrevibacter litoralis TaxID=3106030 RepID=UPI002AFDFC4D|nr:gamma-glutamylcyclotransferase family protein [Arenibacter sp. GZD-96]MEA1786494.1 gamma-glutamylcyclotransferase family protein [Arenibacter sp. GZD-96]
MAFLFTYGTLQEEHIQMTLFKRKLNGAPDTLFGYALSEQKIAGRYPIICKSVLHNNPLNGIVYEITEVDLQKADAYEGDDYLRTEVVLASGTKAWVYTEK